MISLKKGCIERDQWHEIDNLNGKLELLIKLSLRVVFCSNHGLFRYLWFIVIIQQKLKTNLLDIFFVQPK